MQDCQKSKLGSRDEMRLDSKRKMYFSLAYTQTKISLLSFNSIFFLKLFNSAIEFAEIIRILHLFLKHM